MRGGPKAESMAPRGGSPGTSKKLDSLGVEEWGLEADLAQLSTPPPQPRFPPV